MNIEEEGELPVPQTSAHVLRPLRPLRAT